MGWAARGGWGGARGEAMGGQGERSKGMRWGPYSKSAERVGRGQGWSHGWGATTTTTTPYVCMRVNKKVITHKMQYNTRQDKTRQDETRQDNTNHITQFHVI